MACCHVVPIRGEPTAQHRAQAGRDVDDTPEAAPYHRRRDQPCQAEAGRRVHRDEPAPLRGRHLPEADRARAVVAAQRGHADPVIVDEDVDTAEAAFHRHDGLLCRTLDAQVAGEGEKPLPLPGCDRSLERQQRRRVPVRRGHRIALHEHRPHQREADTLAAAADERDALAVLHRYAISHPAPQSCCTPEACTMGA
jgi:hypothetical protein